MIICTILVAVIGVQFKFLEILVSFSVVFRVGLLEEVSISCLTHPHIACFQVIRNLLCDRFWCRFRNERVCVGTSRHHREISSDNIISRLNVLICTFMPRESRAIRSQVLAWTTSLEQILRMRSFIRIPPFSIIILLIVGTQIQMWPIQSIVLFRDLYFVLNRLFLLVAHFVNTSFAKIRLNIFKFAQMSSTSTKLTNTVIWIMMPHTRT